MSERIILLVEDNPNDEALTLRALKKSNILNPVVVARDGAEALDYLFARGAHQGRKAGHPEVVLLDLKLPKVDGLEVLKTVRSTPTFKSVPVVMLTSSPSVPETKMNGTSGRASAASFSAARPSKPGSVLSARMRS
jgi:two-component system response regulator